jgi:hypothetical protein
MFSNDCARGWDCVEEEGGVGMMISLGRTSRRYRTMFKTSAWMSRRGCGLSIIGSFEDFKIQINKLIPFDLKKTPQLYVKIPPTFHNQTGGHCHGEIFFFWIVTRS